MKRLNQLSKLFVVAALIFAGCEGQEQSLIDDRLEDNPIQEPPAPDGTQGSTNLTKFISIGNSLTAGYMDGALYNLGQENSIPALMAQQFQIAVESDGDTFDGFNQPDINSETGFNTVLSANNPDSNTGVIFGRFKLDTNIPGPSPVVGGDLISAYTGPDVHNFGVPGIVVGQLLTPATGGPASPQNPAFNPFYQRFTSNPSPDGASGSYILQEAIASQPTFFTLWIGNNDVLGYAAGGASNPNILTTSGDFSQRFNATIDGLMGNTTADGLVANIHPFLALALFQAVPYNAIPLTDQNVVGALNAGYSDYNNGVNAAFQGGAISEEEASRRQISFSLGANAFVMEDEDLTDLSGFGLPSYRQSEETDLVLLSAASAFPTGVGTQTAAGDNLVLTPEEQVEVETARQTFNAIIAGAVNSYPDRLVLYNTNAADGVFRDLFGISDGTPGIRISGVNLQPDFSPNGVLSTDAVHPNSRGNALIANEMIEAIETKFGAQIPKIDVLNLPSVQICAGDCASQQGKIIN